MRKYVSNGLSFAATGVLIGLVLSVIFSYLDGGGNYYPSGPTFMAQFPNTVDAVLASIVLWGLMGLVFGYGAAIFDIRGWSTLKQTGVNFLVYYLGFTPLAILAGWFPLTGESLLGFTITFIIVYAICWLIGWGASWFNRRLNKRSRMDFE